MPFQPDDSEILEAMAAALGVSGQSPHPTNKIAACLFGHAPDGSPYRHCAANDWPEPIARKLGREVRIGNSSGTVHAETACILKARHSMGAAICITDPFCPNCAKNMAEAGIMRIYIAHDGFEKDFAARRGHHFENMSMRICEKAGISIYSVNVERQSVDPLLEISESYHAPQDNPVRLETIEDEASYPEIIAARAQKTADDIYACALAKNDTEQTVLVHARFHPVIGYTMTRPEDVYDIGNPGGKYSYIQEPVNRILMNLPRHGLRLLKDSIFSSRIPTAREQVNAVGAGIRRIRIGDMDDARDNAAREAARLLSENGLLAFESLA